MTEFLTTHGTAHHIERIIQESTQNLVLVSPYLKLSEIFFDRIKDADKRGIKIVIIYGKDELKPAEKAKLEQLKNISTYFSKNLHAKCYFNENKMVITSMNMYDFSEKNNIEMGVLLTRQSDENAFKSALNEVEYIVRSSEIKTKNKPADSPLPSTHKEKPNSSISHQDTVKPSLATYLIGALSSMLAKSTLDAYCIRCHTKIHFDPYRPLCDNCYPGWARYQNPSYPEQFCHACGRPSNTTKDKPLCSSCYSKLG